MLFVEATKMQGAATLTLTGQLGDVMKESARAALSWVRRNADALRHRSRVLQGRRDPRPRAVGRDPQGRAVGRRHDGDGAGVGADRAPGARRHRDDRRDHAVGHACCRSAASRRRCWRRAASASARVILPRQNEKSVHRGHRRGAAPGPHDSPRLGDRRGAGAGADRPARGARARRRDRHRAGHGFLIAFGAAKGRALQRVFVISQVGRYGRRLSAAPICSLTRRG